MIVCDILQSFAPNYLFCGENSKSTDPNIQITRCIFSSKDINILTFTVRLNILTSSIEFIIDSTKQKYIATSLSDTRKISDFISHLLILESELMQMYTNITKKLTASPSYNSITSYHLFNGSTENTGTIEIKNGIIFFQYYNTTKYNYSSINKLLANPLIKQFKRSKIWFWT